MNPADDNRPAAGSDRPRRTARTEPNEVRESWLLRIGLSITVWLLAGVATILAASGQIEFAHWAGITDVRAYAVPAVLELVAVAFLLIGYRRARRGDSPAALWLLAAAIGGFAVYTNVSHSGRAGLIFGAASAITLLLWFVKLRDDYRHFQRHTGQATRPKPKFGALWLVAPRLTARAWVIAARRRISTVDESMAYAEVWRAVYEDSRNARVRRTLARRTAWRSVAEAAGGVWAELPRTAEVAAVDVVQRPATDAPPARSAIPGPPAGSGRAAGPGPSGPAAVAALAGQSAGSGPAGPATQSAIPVPVAPPAAQVDRRPTPTGVAPTSPMPSIGGPGAPGTGVRSLDTGPSLRDRVFALLDEQFDAEEAQGITDDDPYVLWMTSRAFGVDDQDVVEYVRQWRRQRIVRTAVQ